MFCFLGNKKAPIYSIEASMAPHAGLEPTFTVSKTAVLPLDERGSEIVS